MSGSLNIKYQPLSQSTPSDDEDEGFDDNILYDSRLVNGPSMDRRNLFEMERLGEPRSSSPPNVRYLGRTRRTCVLVTVLLVILLGAVAAILFPLLNHAFNHGVVIDTKVSPPGKDWKRSFNNTWTESNVHVIDVDGQGNDDIILGLADPAEVEAAISSNMTMRQFCKSVGKSHPCGGRVVALKGIDGSEIWQTWTRSIVIHQTCGAVDVDGDTVKDCIVTGRHSTCQAIDMHSGKILWIVDPELPTWSSHFEPKWNVYKALSIPDLDGDGILDLLVSHGRDREHGDNPKVPGRLILLSGGTGHPIGKIVDLPDHKQTYMPAIKYVTPEGAVYILIGSGSETVSGDLLAISLLDLYHVAMETSSSGDVPELDTSKIAYTWLSSISKIENRFSVIYSGGNKGVLVPPVLVDVDKDEHVDLLVSTFEGRVSLLDGRDLHSKWVRHFPGMETHSTPAPGKYNRDAFVDFMIHLNSGTWDKYNFSQTLVLDGMDGSTLWSVEAGSYSYSSDLSLRALMGIPDIFLLKLVGRNSSGTRLQSEIGINVRKNRHHEFENKPSYELLSNFTSEEFQLMCKDKQAAVMLEHLSCDNSLRSLTQEVFLIDSAMADSPLQILEEKAVRYHYQLNHQPGTFHCHPVSERHKTKIDMCVVLSPTSYTGAVGDLDGDGSPDYVHMTQLSGPKLSDTMDYTGSMSEVVISKSSLRTAILEKHFVPLDLKVGQPERPGMEQKHIEILHFQPMSSQPWSQYLGSQGDSWYQTPP